VLVHPKCLPANPGGFPTHAHELGSLSAERLSVG
jgi:hypothetical protein